MKLDVATLKRVLMLPRRVEKVEQRVSRGERSLSEATQRFEARASWDLDVATKVLAARGAGSRAIFERLASGPDVRAPLPLADHPPYQVLLDRLRELAPAAYALWRPLLDVNADAYAGFPTHSCSVVGHGMAEAFRDFLASYLHGPVLDIGCGPQPVPVYLSRFPFERIAGLDPIAPPQPHPFVFVRGVTEFLPWADASFDSVVCATSLDHVLLLDRSLDEVARVLRPGGRFLLWVAFIAGAEPYRPYDAPSAKDEFHLFHFDRPWFEAELGRRFELEETFEFGPGQISWFYAYRRRA